MKTIKFLFVLLGLSLLTACESPTEQSSDGDRATYDLCRTKWESFFLDDLGIKCQQTFLFEKNGNGIETFTAYKPFDTITEQYTFSWYWTSGYFNSIAIEYSPTDRIFFDHIQVGYNFLNGYLNGAKAEFHPYTMP